MASFLSPKADAYLPANPSCGNACKVNDSANSMICTAFFGIGTDSEFGVI
jgi:hypothetical protein